MPQIEINCPRCGAHYSLGAEISRKVKCAECEAKFFIGEDGSVTIAKAVVAERAAEFAAPTRSEFEKFVAAAKAALLHGDWGAALAHARNARACRGYEAAPQALDLWNAAGIHGFREKFRRAWCMRTFTGHTYEITSVCLSADARWALSGGIDNTLRLWDMAAGQCVRTFYGHFGGVDSVALSGDAHWALTVGDASPLELWDLTTGQCVRDFEGDSGKVTWLSDDGPFGDRATGKNKVISVCLSADARRALSVSLDGMLQLWDVAAGLCLRTFVGHPGRVGLCSYCVCLSADARRALSGGVVDKTLRLWDVATGLCLRTFVGHTEGVSSVCLSADARWAFSGSGDKTLRLWDVATGLCLRTFVGHTGAVSSVCLSADARWVLSGSGDKTLRLWDVATGLCLRTFAGHTEGVSSVCLSGDARWALSGSGDGTMRLWELHWDFTPREPTNWDDGARPHLQNFLTIHTPYAGELPDARPPTDDEICAVLIRHGKPSWTEEGFQQLLYTLACAGYGWLRPEGVRRELEKMAADWQGPPALI